MTTFMGVPAASAEDGGVTVLGVPFDCGPSRGRSGPHLAPAAIRAASARLLPARIDSDRDPLRELDVRDGGDVDVSLADPTGSLAAVVDAVSDVLARRAVPLVLGGDGSIALAMMRAIAREIGEVAVIHLDAHTDCNPPGEGINEASSAFWLADAEGLLATTASVHVGLRGPALNANSAGLARQLGYQTIGVDEIVDSGISSVLDQVRQIVGERPVYLCWDIDVFDPSVAPGVFSPSWGGIGAAAGLRLVRGLAGLAAQLAFELLFSLPRP